MRKTPTTYSARERVNEMLFIKAGPWPSTVRDDGMQGGTDEGRVEWVSEVDSRD